MFFVLIYCLVDKTQKFKCATNLIALGQTMVVELGAVGERGSRVGAELQQRGGGSVLVREGNVRTTTGGSYNDITTLRGQKKHKM